MKEFYKVVDAWTSRKERKTYKSFWTDGFTIYSYGTPILFRDPIGNRFIMNTKKYSVTTSRYQNKMKQFLIHAECNILYVDH